MPFDIGFLELTLVAIISLIVLGPERLPTAARAVGRWVGKAKKAFSSVKDELNRELQIEELRQQIAKQQETMNDLVGKSQQSIDEFARETEINLKASQEAFQRDLEAQQRKDEALLADSTATEEHNSQPHNEYEPFAIESKEEKPSSKSTNDDDKA